MDAADRERRLNETFVALADTLVADFDIVDLMDRLIAATVDLLGASAAGLMLTDQRGSLRVMASSSERTRLLELFQLESDDGPCLAAFRSGQPTSVDDLMSEDRRWPRFTAQALAVGFRAVHACPMRLRAVTIGAFNLFHTEPGPLPDADLRAAQALADVATIGILQQRAIHRGEVLTEQLQAALNSRVVIELAKGILAELGRIDMGEAFIRMRDYARAHNLKLATLATDLVRGQVTPVSVLATKPMGSPSA